MPMQNPASITKMNSDASIPGNIPPWGTRSLHKGSVTPAGRQPSHGDRRWGSKRTKAENRWRGPFWLCSSHREGMARRASVLYMRGCTDRHSSRRANKSQLAKEPALSTCPSHWATCSSRGGEKFLTLLFCVSQTCQKWNKKQRFSPSWGVTSPSLKIQSLAHHLCHSSSPVRYWFPLTQTTPTLFSRQFILWYILLYY